MKFIWRKGSRDVAEKLRKPIRPQDESILIFIYLTLNEVI
jgi:hypothetical protein